MSSGGSTHRPTRCLYEALEVARTANAAELKKAYRKAALRYHPDKNVGNDEATAMFQEIQHAYAVLSDANERKWYDDHRDDILRGRDGDADDSDKQVNIFQYFSPTACSGYGDDKQGFYTVYTQAFEAIFRAEADQYDAGFTAPVFGRSDAEYSTVAAFYAFWTHFSSRLSFAWEDEYNPNDATNRRIRRLMEKENTKSRAEARREYCTEVKSLVDFVRRRDRRVIHEKVRQQQQKQEQEANKQKEAAVRAEDMKRRKAAWAAERSAELAAESSYEESSSDESSAGEDAAATYAADGAEGGEHDDASAAKQTKKRSKKPVRLADEDTDAKAKASKSSREQIVYRCAVCKKDFKSDKQMKNHEASKAHKKKMADLDAALLKEALANRQHAADAADADADSEESDASSSSSDALHNVDAVDDDDLYIDPVMQELELGMSAADFAAADAADNAQDSHEAQTAAQPPNGYTTTAGKRAQSHTDARIDSNSSSSSSSSSGNDSSDESDSDSDVDVTRLAGSVNMQQTHTQAHADARDSSSADSDSSDDVHDLQRLHTQTHTHDADADASASSGSSDEHDSDTLSHEHVQLNGQSTHSDTAHDQHQPDSSSSKTVDKQRSANKAKLRRAKRDARARGYGTAPSTNGHANAHANTHTNKASSHTGSDLTCKVCGQAFGSRTKMFAHIKSSGHAALKS